MTTKTLILGIGNTLLGDEGAGVYAVRALASLQDGRQDQDIQDLEFLDGGTLSFTLAAPIEEADQLIVIDAAQLKADAGTVRVFEGAEMDAFLGANRKRSVHEVGLIDLMSIARLTDSLPARRALIGIQPQYVDWAEQPTAAVAAAIPKACEEALSLIRRWSA